MGVKKQYLRSNNVCKVSFSLKNKGKDIESVKIVGDFNNWNSDCEPMKKMKSGDFSQVLSFESGKSYQFRYLINDSVWTNEPECDELVPNGFGQGELNSSIVI